jgi:exodeoxyribonuclease V alpha subunit
MGLAPGPPFRVGDKVSRTKNGLADGMAEVAGDHEHVDWRWGGRDWKFVETYLVNGDLGVVVDIVEGERWSHAVVRFRDPDRLVRLPMAEHHLILAYALTVHRMQGSGCKYVIVPVSELFYYDWETGQGLWNRELLYTAISRTEQLLVSVGPFAAIPKAIGRKTVGKRKTTLVERIRVLTGAVAVS